VTHDDPIERLFALEQFGIKLGLDNIRSLLAALGNPQLAFGSVHVAGTNGKGSVTAMVERALRNAGHRTGRYTSPHLARIEERVSINGTPIDNDAFRKITFDVLALVQRLRADRALETTPTFFEVTTAIAFEAFRRARVDIAVVEVGLGGRFDATNFITPLVSAITSIAFDHQRHLGNTLGSIAFEKAGILKTGVPAVVGDVPLEARSVIEAVAAEQNVQIVDAPATLVDHVTMRRGRATVTVVTPFRRYEDVELALHGTHQIANGVVAVRVLEQLERAGVALSSADIVSGLTHVEWPARLEWLRLDDTRTILLDAAHNVAGARALAAYLSDSGYAPLPLVLAVMKDKDVDGIVAALAPVVSGVVATSVGLPRAMSTHLLIERVRTIAPQMPVQELDDPNAAVDAAFVASPRAAAAGSIFFVGPLREKLLADGALSLQSS
jgi:dihydrofolate synthase/folylpolyglutamate synthase